MRYFIFWVRCPKIPYYPKYVFCFDTTTPTWGFNLKGKDFLLFNTLL